VSDGLHGGVVEDRDRHAECGARVEVFPTRPEVDRVAKWPALPERRRKPDRDGVESLTGEHAPDVGDELLGRVAAPGIHLPLLRPVRTAHLCMRSTDI